MGPERLAIVLVPKSTKLQEVIEHFPRVLNVVASYVSSRLEEPRRDRVRSNYYTFCNKDGQPRKKFPQDFKGISNTSKRPTSSSTWLNSQGKDYQT